MGTQEIWSEYMREHPLGTTSVTCTTTKIFRLWAFQAKVYSQNNEDGILFYILHTIRPSVCEDKQLCVVELGCGDGYENNSSNLIRHHGYCGILVDGNQENITRARIFLEGKSDVTHILHHWMTRDNIVPLLSTSMPVSWSLDVLILDIDGNDFWVLRSIMASGRWTPRVIMVEYQDILGPTVAMTIPYDENFYAWVNPWNSRGCEDGPNFSGASLMAFVRLLRPYGYVFVGCEPKGFNGFFVHQECLPSESSGNFLPVFHDDEIPVLFQLIPKVREGMKHRFTHVKDAPWIDPFAICQEGK